MTNDTFPLQQGRLDYLCGIYAAINAKHLAGELQHTDQAAIPFRLALHYMQSQGWDVAGTVCRGIEPDDYFDLLRQLHWWDVEVIDLSDAPFAAIEEWRRNNAQVIVSLLYHGTTEVMHYTVVKGVDGDGLDLYDSQGVDSLLSGGGDYRYDNQKVDIGTCYALTMDRKRHGKR